MAGGWSVGVLGGREAAMGSLMRVGLDVRYLFGNGTGRVTQGWPRNAGRAVSQIRRRPYGGRSDAAMVDSGITPLAVVSASTKTGAEVIGRDGDLGTIEPGKLADIIVVEGNPLFDINDLGYVRMVVEDGVR